VSVSVFVVASDLEREGREIGERHDMHLTSLAYPVCLFSLRSLTTTIHPAPPPLWYRQGISNLKLSFHIRLAVGGRMTTAAVEERERET
jgi:hypothetical protein